MFSTSQYTNGEMKEMNLPALTALLKASITQIQ